MRAKGIWCYFSEKKQFYLKPYQKILLKINDLRIDIIYPRIF